MRVFLDTNVLVSAVATRGLCTDVVHTVLAEHLLILGETVLEELRRVLREKLRTSEAVAGELEALLRREATVIANAPALPIELRDADDLAVLQEAVAGRADVLVTGDRDLLEVSGKSPIVILSPRGFWDRLRADSE